VSIMPASLRCTAAHVQLLGAELVAADHVGVAELGVEAAVVVVERVLHATEVGAFEVVGVGTVAQRQPGDVGAGQVDAVVEVREVLDPRIEVGHLHAEAVAIAKQRFLEDIETGFPVMRLLGLEERVGVHQFVAAAVRLAAHERFGHGRRRQPRPQRV
jgi:hypothetical protein